MMHRCKAIGPVSFDFGNRDRHIASWNTRTSATSEPDPSCGIKEGETIAQAAERWAQWCEARGNQMLANFLRKQASATSEAAIAQPEPAMIDMSEYVERMPDGLYRPIYKTDLLTATSTKPAEANYDSLINSVKKQPALQSLTTEQIKKGWEATFSTDNPFYPCNLKSFTKAAHWAEHAMLAAHIKAKD